MLENLISITGSCSSIDELELSCPAWFKLLQLTMVFVGFTICDAQNNELLIQFCKLNSSSSIEEQLPVMLTALLYWLNTRTDKSLEKGKDPSLF